MCGAAERRECADAAMAKFWKEVFDPNRHRDFMDGFVPDGGVAPNLQAGIDPVYFVRVCGFTFQFVDMDQIRHALTVFSRSVQPSSRIAHDGLEHWYHRWFERLPAGLTSGSKRDRIRTALARALDEFDAA